jgi:hypothetical protein
VTLKIDSGVEALQEQAAKNTQSIEDVAGSTQAIISNVQLLQSQNAHISEAIEAGRLRMLHAAGPSFRGTLGLTFSLCRRTTPEDL